MDVRVKELFMVGPSFKVGTYNKEWFTTKFWGLIMIINFSSNNTCSNSKTQEDPTSSGPFWSGVDSRSRLKILLGDFVL